MNTTILVVEDEILIADDIQRTLTHLGYNVPVTAATGREAIAAAEQGRPQLALMDIKLRGAMDGIEAARVLRARFGIPIVFLTSHSDEKTLARAKETQPQGYLLKPFSDRELRTAIEVALHNHALESHLAERERWFSTTLESIGDAVIATDPDENVTLVNAMAERVIGKGRQEVIGKKLSEVLRLLDPSGEPIESPVGRALREAVAVGLPGGTSLLLEGGARIAVDDSAAPIVDDHGNVLGGVVVFRDITERKKLEQRLTQSERLASIGTMAAGMAHEINNPLAYVLGNLGFTVEGLKAVIQELDAIRHADPAAPGAGVKAQLEELLDLTREASQGAQRIRRIVHDLNGFTRVSEALRSLVDLPRVLEMATKMTANAVRHHARLRKDYGPTPLVDANEGQLLQVFTNLLINAVQAIGEGGADRHEICVSTRTGEGGRAVVEVRDTGAGIPAAALGRVFEPFFTTKPQGSGLGLGLSICHNIIVAAGGEITAESVLGEGTTFRVTLPAARKKAEAPAPPRAEIVPLLRRGKILVVDDEPAVARTIERMLRAEHDVAIFAEGQLVLESVIAGASYDAIFCDLMMPNMTGMDLYQAIFALNPEQARRMVFMTGGVFSQKAREFVDGLSNVTLEKPFAIEAVQALARGLVK